MTSNKYFSQKKVEKKINWGDNFFLSLHSQTKFSKINENFVYTEEWKKFLWEKIPEEKLDGQRVRLPRLPRLGNNWSKENERLGNFFNSFRIFVET